MGAFTITRTAEHLLFGDGDEHLRLPSSQDGWFAAAVRRARNIDSDFPYVWPHDLRHTAASLAVSAGANVKAVQRILAHASAAMTLDAYADPFDDDLDYVAQALSRARDSQRTSSATTGRLASLWLCSSSPSRCSMCR
ncbi:tyrosine-type recombinase/integrase [Microbacterium invictum]|uniref:tyrosine-type recombinase/integrase n=1 Tax=Microbacterium invictum TaxID=515415 RepID=UPI003A102D19